MEVGGGATFEAADRSRFLMWWSRTCRGPGKP